MRPVPQTRHLLAVMIFAAVAAMEGYFASIDDRLSDAQVNIATAAVKRHDPGLFEHDPILGERRLWMFHTPAFQSLLELVLVPTNYEDLRLPFRAMAGVITLVYLCGAYALLFFQTRSWSVSAFVAVLSSRVIETLGGGYWGIGSLDSITPAGLCTALFPLIVLAFARYCRPAPGEPPSAQWRLLLVFGFVGLLGNFHLVTAMNVTIVLLIAYVARQRFSPRALPMALACGLCALLAALPFAGYYFGVRALMSQGAPDVDIRTVHEAFRIGGLTTLYPDLLKALLDWRLLVAVLVLVLPAAGALWRIERFKTQNVGFWGWLVVGGLVVSLGLHGLSQWIGRMLNAPPPVIDFPEASSLILLPLYVLLAQAITNVFRLVRKYRGLVRWACAVLLVAWMLPSDNFRVARHAAADLATAFLPEDDKPSYVLRHREQSERNRELAAIGQWAARQGQAIFLTDRGEFRMLSRHSILAGPNDARYLYYLCPGRLGEWLARYKTQAELLHPTAGGADGEAIAHFVAEQIDRSDRPAELRLWAWYVVLQASATPEKPGPLQPVEDAAWGSHYRLYRIP